MSPSPYNGTIVESVGWVALGLAALIGLLNFYLSFLRFPIYRYLGRPYRWMSGIPLIGSVCLVIALACVSGSVGAWIAAGVIAAIDTAGIPWIMGVFSVRGWISVTKDPEIRWPWLIPALLLLLLAFIVSVLVAFVGGWLESPRP
jgi:hypothetical protein